VRDKVSHPYNVTGKIIIMPSKVGCGETIVGSKIKNRINKIIIIIIIIIIITTTTTTTISQ
jgi:hypothetical protein